MKIFPNVALGKEKWATTAIIIDAKGSKIGDEAAPPLLLPVSLQDEEDESCAPTFRFKSGFHLIFTLLLTPLHSRQHSKPSHLFPPRNFKLVGIPPFIWFISVTRQRPWSVSAVWQPGSLPRLQT